MVEVWSLFPSPTRRSWPKRRSPSPSSRPTWKASWVGRLWIAQGRQGQAHYKIYILSNYYLIYFMLVAKLFFFTRLLPNCPCPYCYLGVKCPRAFVVQNCLCAKLPHYFCETKLRKEGFFFFFRSSWIECSFQSAARRFRCWLARPMRIIKSETCFRKTWCWERLVISMFYFFGDRWYIFRFHSTFTRRMCSAEPGSWAVEWFRSILWHFPY